MNIEKIYQELISIVPKEQIKLNEQMSKHTSFKIGGPADIFVEVKTAEQIEAILKIVKENNVNYKVIGNGSNILVKDEGFRGIIIRNNIEEYKILEEGNNVFIIASAGTKLAFLGQNCLTNGIEGFEFACGIPGTIGGAIKMNAGAHGKEMVDIVESVTYIDNEGNIKTISNEECKFEYRNSMFSKEKFIIIEAKFKLQKGSKEDIKAKMDEYKQYRVDKQPIEFPNGGSTFKRGKDFITAKLIDDAGLKGYSIGGAQISEKHAGFIVNTGNATAQDVLELSKYVQEQIYIKLKKKIELEIEII